MAQSTETTTVSAATNRPNEKCCFHNTKTAKTIKLYTKSRPYIRNVDDSKSATVTGKLFSHAGREKQSPLSFFQRLGQSLPQYFCNFWFCAEEPKGNAECTKGALRKAWSRHSRHLVGTRRNDVSHPAAVAVQRGKWLCCFRFVRGQKSSVRAWSGDKRTLCSSKLWLPRVN